MAILFREYELLAQSGLFDAEYYVGSNPDVAALNVDPLLHYLERGALELRNPSKVFDARQYAEACLERGERVENPLLHYLKSGATQEQKFIPSELGSPINQAHSAVTPPSPALDAGELRLGLDRVSIETSHGTNRLTGSGWCLAASPIVELEVTLGDTTTRARYGLQRLDVARKFPEYLKADHSGFEFVLDRVPDEQTGVRELAFTTKSTVGAVMQYSVPIDLGEIYAATKSQNAIAEAAAARPVLSQPPMQLYIDAATVDESGILQIVGWAVCLAPIVSVQVFVDDERLAAADFGKPREDVAASHALYPNARHSGFALQTDISRYGGGERLVKVQALASTGISRESILPLKFPNAPNVPAPSNDRSKVHLFCDLLEVTLGGRISISGWAVGIAPTERLCVLLDGDEIGDAKIGIERPDVGNQFPSLNHARQAGFSFRHAVSAVSSGEHLVILRHVANGEETDILLPVLAVPGGGADVAAETTGPSAAADLRLSIDLPLLSDGAVATPIRGNFEIVGWALARQGVATVEISIDGERVTSAYTGIRRRDVQVAFPDWENAITAGFSALLPHRTLPKGQHLLSVALRDKSGASVSTEFRINVEDAPDTDGPWALRRRMNPAEIDLHRRPLLGTRAPPTFGVILSLPNGASMLAQARATIASLRSQCYPDWRLYILCRTRQPTALGRALLGDFADIKHRVEIVSTVSHISRLLDDDSAGSSQLMVLRPGDELGCDALLEFAVQTALHPDADMLYCDERRLNPSSGKIEAFFKPQWSPDLMLSMNYLGRAWTARTDTFRRAIGRAGNLFTSDDYDLALRMTEQATAIRHIPATLMQAAEGIPVQPESRRRALQRALARRGIKGTVKPGRAADTFRVRRQAPECDLVSIIIPTCAARGLIRTCIETLRSLTSYKHYEIVCIENIPADQQQWKDWLRANADTVIETFEPFNWSRFNNIAMSASRGKYLLFLNDDIEIIDPGWLETLLEQAQRPEVGVVGPQLLYPDRRVQHAGMFLAGLGVARHAFRYAEQNDPCYFGLALVQREVIAVTGACFMTRRETFDLLGRFDETHDVVNNDIDYCLRIQRRGLRTIYTPHTTLIHHELASRSELPDSYNSAAFESKWRSMFVTGDPYFHPRLAIDRDDYSNEWEPVQEHCAGNPVLTRESIRRILVLKLDHIGDCVIALPAVRRLKRYFPEARICVLTGRASKAVWALEPAVDELIEFDFFHARSGFGKVERTEADWADLRKRLVPYQFDLAIDLRKHWETRHVLQHTGARYFAGYDTKGRFPWLDVSLEWSEDIALIRKRAHTTDDLINLVDAVAAASEPDRALIAKLPPPLSAGALAKLPTARRMFRKRVVCVHPSAGNEMKQWPLEYFGVLIDQLIEAEDIHVILVGGSDEVDLAESIVTGVANPKSVWSVVGRLALSDLPALIARCALFVGNDSGPKHIAAGLGIPTIGIHSGVVDSYEWGPKGPNAVAIQRAMTCAPCYRLKLEDCSRGLACLRGLLPADVVRVCQRLLRTSSTDARFDKVPLHRPSFSVYVQ